MGGSPVLVESSPMVSSPLHITTSLGERLVKTTPPTNNFGGRVNLVKDSDTQYRDPSASFYESLMLDESNNSSTGYLCGTLLHDSDAADAPHAKHVAFGDICTRSYAVIMGDHPCCTVGCPLSLGWDYDQNLSVSVDEYEASRPPRRTREDLRTTWDQRRNRLTGVTDHEVKRAERRLNRERNCQRKNRTRMCAAFFTQDLPEDCKAAAAAAVAQTQQQPQPQCT